MTMIRFAPACFKYDAEMQNASASVNMSEISFFIFRTNSINRKVRNKLLWILKIPKVLRRVINYNLNTE